MLLTRKAKTTDTVRTALEKEGRNIVIEKRRWKEGWSSTKGRERGGMDAKEELEKVSLLTGARDLRKNKEKI